MDRRKRLLMDVLLIAVLLALTGILYFQYGKTDEAGTWAVVRVDGREVARYAMDQNGVYPLNGGTNVLAIDKGEAWIQEADCPDHVCMLMGKISMSGQVITCLPNRLTVTVEGGEQLVDMITG